MGRICVWLHVEPRATLPIRAGVGMSFEFTLYDALLSIDVPADKARAVIDALEHDMGSTLATKQDILLLKQDIVLVKQELEHRIDSMTIRLGSILVVALGLLFAALKLT
jgi:hypothetical protein